MTDFKIKPELKEKFEKTMGMNCGDSYSFAVVKAAVKMIEALDGNQTPKETVALMNGMDLTGYMAGAAAQIVSQYHVRGDEFRIHWNERYGVTEEAAKGGTVNPAILTIG